ncbi:hypothetical protein MASR1M45_08540 [Candidatus Kapaibacterium sp.]
MIRFSILIFIIIAVLQTYFVQSQEVIIDSEMTFEEAIKGTKAPKKIIDSLTLVDVEYFSFDGKLHRGQVVVNIAVKDDVIEAFKIIKEQKFPVQKVIPIVKYDWDDNESMEQNNTSAFNYRFVAGTERLSHHATGRAIDINPRNNPVIYNDGKISPKGCSYNPNAKGSLKNDFQPVTFFKSNGWRWGGDWTSLKDYHHFDKP